MHLKPGLWTLTVAAIMLLLAWRLAPFLSSPLYDGLGLPSEPYRYLRPPPGTPHGRAPTQASLRVPVIQGTLDTEDVTTGERPPQARLIVDQGVVHISPGTRHVTLAVIPLPPATPINDGVLDGNVYRFSAVNDAGAKLSLNPKRTATITLRGTGLRGNPVIRHLVGKDWVALKTNRLIGTSIFITSSGSLGEFALVLPAKAGTSAGGSGGNSLLPLLVAGAILLVLLAAALAAVRISRSRATE